MMLFQNGCHYGHQKNIFVTNRPDCFIWKSVKIKKQRSRDQIFFLFYKERALEESKYRILHIFFKSTNVNYYICPVLFINSYAHIKKP